jgi:hypothetical protein
MDNLKSLMSCIDDISKMIPEGTYLEMCDNLKKVHDNMPKHEDPPVRDSRRPRVAAPFQVVQPGVDVHRLINVVSDSESDEDEDDSDDEPWQPEWYDEWTQNEDMIRRLLADLKIAKTSLRTLKPIQRITKKVRDGAMRHFSASTPILDMDIFDENETDEATFENYVRITEWANFSPADRKEYTSKKFEKKIYEDYKMFENYRIARLIDESRELKRNLEIEISDVRDRQSYLRVHYNL